LPVLDKDDIRRQLDLPKTAKVYLFLSRVSPDKSPELLIESWSKANTPPDAMLIIAGPYDPEYGAALLKLTTKLNVSESIRFPGYADNDAKRKWLSAADIFVLPSTDDSFSVAVIEAARFGLHCVLSPYVGAAEYIPESQLSIAPLNEKAWSVALENTAKSGEITENYSFEWMNQFTMTALGEQWMTLYSEISKIKSRLPC
jgi:glycosyltransferase involved in cell wall biosynthesis